ncbi:DUF4192 family protein [Arthrobacter cryoconiti]|uniref:DUF4192 family protein n=1 Tax=Arthrobacter cryoconiti TaxID=748907 RepID=A0ABV8R1H2_9MICC|nr:DUF4192 family protein [Arthrobacter cryoconiti]MCC9069308.1 DUF4192 domain-containing protein [Arthrobacter cryoconiti]
MTSPLKAGSPADLLAFVPVQLGFWPENSLVLISMQGKLLRAVLRADLPPVGSNTAETALALSAMISSDVEADAYLGAIYAPAMGDASENASHYRELISDLELALPHELHQMFIVSGGMVLNMAEGSAFSVEEIHSSPMALEFMMMGRGYAPDSTTMIPTAPELPHSDLKILAKVQGAFNEEVDEGVESVKNIWHSCPEVNELDHGGYLILLASVQNRECRDAALATIMSAERIPEGDEDTMAKFLIGSPEVTPDWERAAGFVKVLHNLLTIATGRFRLAPLTMMGVIEWYKGHGTYCNSYLSEALAIDPDYRLAVLMNELNIAGYICPWATTPETAFPGQ